MHEKPSWQMLFLQLISCRFENHRRTVRSHPTPPHFQKTAVQKQSPFAAGAGVILAAGTGFPSDESLLKDLKHAHSGYKAAHVLYCYFFIAASLGQRRVICGAGLFLRSPSEPRSSWMQHHGESLPSSR